MGKQGKIIGVNLLLIHVRLHFYFYRSLTHQRFKCNSGVARGPGGVFPTPIPRNGSSPKKITQVIVLGGIIFTAGNMEISVPKPGVSTPVAGAYRRSFEPGRPGAGNRRLSPSDVS